MKEALKVLEDNWADMEKGESTMGPALFPANVSSPTLPLGTGPGSSFLTERRHPADDTYEQEDTMDSINALRDMRCYVRFVDEHIMPTMPISRIGGMGKGLPIKIRFDDLWFLFKPGQNIISTYKERIVSVGSYRRRPSGRWL